jgi:hypothetical protein
MNWSADEIRERRRIVEFSGYLVGNSIHCMAGYFPSADGHIKGTLVSCIYWLEKDAYYITSADFLKLVGGLTGVKLGPKEKGQKRRNLENFERISISKEDPEMKESFDMVIGFDEPHPYNIKTTTFKVFRWSDLKEMLQKIVSKYVGIRVFLSVVARTLTSNDSQYLDRQSLTITARQDIRSTHHRYRGYMNQMNFFSCRNYRK